MRAAPARGPVARRAKLRRIRRALASGSALDALLDPADRRAWCLHLTAKVEPILERMEALVNQTQAEALTGIENADKARLLETLLAMKQNMLATESANQNGQPDRKTAGVEDVTGRP